MPLVCFPPPSTSPRRQTSALASAMSFFVGGAAQSSAQDVVGGSGSCRCRSGNPSSRRTRWRIRSTASACAGTLLASWHHSAPESATSSEHGASNSHGHRDSKRFQQQLSHSALYRRLHASPMLNFSHHRSGDETNFFARCCSQTWSKDMGVTFRNQSPKEMITEQYPARAPSDRRTFSRRSPSEHQS